MTRMWGVPPRWLCRQHLLGEHNEIHQLVGYIGSGRDWSAKLQSHAEAGEIDTRLIQDRHDDLAAEMLRRGYNHESPLNYDDDQYLGHIDADQAREDLIDRCGECAVRILTEDEFRQRTDMPLRVGVDFDVELKEGSA